MVTRRAPDRNASSIARSSSARPTNVEAMAGRVAGRGGTTLDEHTEVPVVSEGKARAEPALGQQRTHCDHGRAFNDRYSSRRHTSGRRCHRVVKVSRAGRVQVST
jgi:hypothetical protein